MRRYVCPKCRYTCRCGRQPGQDAGKVLAWFFGITFFTFLLFWPAMFLKGTDALYTELGWLGAIIAVIVTTILVKANSPEIREREREE